MEDTKPTVSLKPGNKSTEFMGKIVLQLFILCNMVGDYFGYPLFKISPEISLAVAGGIEAVWMIFRQWNKRLEIKNRANLLLGYMTTELEGVKGAMKFREMNTDHAHKLEQVRAVKETSQTIANNVKEMENAKG